MRTPTPKREKLLHAAKALIYQRGFSQTTLAEIAQSAQIALGNVYYYFKTKDDLARAVIDDHQTDFANLFLQWEQLPSPKLRLAALLSYLEDSRPSVARYGCPIGSLCLELNKDNPQLAPYANDMIKTTQLWLEQQFKEWGHTNAADLAIQMLVRLQGISIVAMALHNPQLVQEQVQHMRDWLDELT